MSTIAMTGAQPSTNAAVEAETMQHFQALLRIDTSSPPGNETKAAQYLKGILDKEGIPSEILALEPARGNLVARIKWALDPTSPNEIYIGDKKMIRDWM